MAGFAAAFGLGSYCTTKYQLDRLFGRRLVARTIFDSQLTPPSTVIEYLERDFEGLLELDDLGPGPVSVCNYRFFTGHRHEWPEDANHDQIAAGYDKARARHEHLCANTRLYLKQSQPLLIVVSQPNVDVDTAPLAAALRAYNPAMNFEIVGIPPDATQKVTKPGSWKGDDALWDAALAPYQPQQTLRWQVRKVLKEFGGKQVGAVPTAPSA